MKNAADPVVLFLFVFAALWLTERIAAAYAWLTGL